MKMWKVYVRHIRDRIEDYYRQCVGPLERTIRSNADGYTCFPSSEFNTRDLTANDPWILIPGKENPGGMLKHVSVSPWRGRADSVSLSSSGGASSCGSGSPTPGHTPPPSRASSCASLAPLTALSSFSPADNAPQQVSDHSVIIFSRAFAKFVALRRNTFAKLTKFRKGRRSIGSSVLLSAICTARKIRVSKLMFRE